MCEVTGSMACKPTYNKRVAAQSTGMPARSKKIFDEPTPMSDTFRSSITKSKSQNGLGVNSLKNK